MNLYYLKGVLAKADKLIKNLNSNLEIKRVYIPKNKNEYRPLGVPTPEWRLVLHMLNNFLYYFIKDELLSSMHGFIPGKGTLSAWKEFFTKGIYKYPYILEYDLKKFFDLVDLRSLKLQLYSLNLPWNLVDYLIKINEGVPILPKDIKLVEHKVQANALLHSMIKKYFPYHEGIDVVRWCMSHLNSTAIDNPFRYIKDHVRSAVSGVAQGAPTSPLLSILTLKEFLSQQKSLSYADDGIFYGEKKFEIKDQPEKGILLHPTKTMWVKEGGKWKKPLKFLGLEYDGKTLRARTRKGSTLVLGKKIKKIISLLDDLEKKGEMTLVPGVNSPGKWRLKEKSFEDLFKSKLMGFIQSRLYQGQWNLDNLEQDFELKFNSGSWLSERESKWWDPELSTFNASTYASKSLANLMRYWKKNLPRRERHIRLLWFVGRAPRR